MSKLPSWQTVASVIAGAEKLWPTQLADEWDRPGLVLGDLTKRVAKVLLSVDITDEVIEDAIDGEYDMIISHHPYLLKGATTLAENTGKGLSIARAVRAGLAIFAAHTNADVTETGVSATLAKALELKDIHPLVGDNKKVGHGRIGKTNRPTNLIDLARRVASVLPATAGGVRVAGDSNQVINSVALCAGAGDAFLGAALGLQVDVYITSDLRHHPAIDSLENSRAIGKSMALIDISHWAAESLWLNVAANELTKAVSGVKFEVCDLRTDPWDFAVTQ